MTFAYTFDIDNDNMFVVERNNLLAFMRQAFLNQDEAGTDAEALAAVQAVESTVWGAVRALGDHWQTANVRVTGHVNPGNKARPGWSNDFIQVGIIVTEYKAEEAEPESAAAPVAAKAPEPLPWQCDDAECACHDYEDGKDWVEVDVASILSILNHRFFKD